MDLLKELEELRYAKQILQNWDDKIEQEKQKALYKSMPIADRVQTSKKIDSMEAAIIGCMDLESKKENVIARYMKKQMELTEIVYRHCDDIKDIQLVCGYFFQGKSLKELNRKSKNSIIRAVNNIQENMGNTEIDN